MKQKRINLVVMLLISINCISQDIGFKAIYGIKTEIDFGKIRDKDTINILMLKKILNNTNDPSNVKFELLFNNEASIFSFKFGLNSTSSKIDLASIKANQIGKIYTNFKTREIIQQKEIFGEVFRIRSSLEDYHWQLINEKMQFGEYTVYKAIDIDPKKRVNKITEAWYAPEIKISTGPLGFGGLPGLIVILKNDIFTYYLEQLSSDFKNKILLPKKGKLVLFKEYDSIYDVLYARKEQLEMDKH